MNTLWYLPVASLVVFLLFSFMAQLAGLNTPHEFKQEEDLVINVSRMRFDSDLNIRKRQRIPPPEPQQTQTQSASAPQQEMLMSVPDITPTSAPLNVDIKLDIGATLGTIKGLDIQTDSGLALNLTQLPITRVNPTYPRRALQRGIEGEVTAEFTVNREGSVLPDSLVIIKADPPGVFDKTVKRAIMRWRFNPFVKNDQAQPFKTRQKLVFKM